MTMWMIIVYTIMILTCAALLYVCSRASKFFCLKKFQYQIYNRPINLSALIVFILFVLTAVLLNLANAAVCVVYFALIWAIFDILFYLIKKLFKKTFKFYWAGLFAILTTLCALSYGCYQDHNVIRTEYTLTTAKNIKLQKILLFADCHLGTTFDAEGFSKHLAEMQTPNPDILVIAGDFIDDDTKKEDMLAATTALGKFKTKYGIYFAFGNHDRDYYEPSYRGYSVKDVIDALEKNGVKVLQDETILLDDNFYIIGRKDFSETKEHRGSRLSMTELTQNLDNKKYMLVIDHQPTDYKNQADANVDLVLSGHTHGGQLFPFNKVGEWIGANDRIYGYEKRSITDFIVTSGLSDWAIKFKTGTKSEYVIINLKASN